MKHFFPIALLATVLFASNANATQLTCNNANTSPGQYTDLNTAINAAKAGDTVLVTGSGTDYATNGEITIAKKLTLLGTGYNPIKDIPFVSTISTVHLQGGSAGTVIAGFNITNQVYSDGGVQINSVLIKRNNINTIYDNQGDNWVIQENMLHAFGMNGNNIAIKNNVIVGGYPYTPFSNTSGNTNFIFSNNVVFREDIAQGYGHFYNALVNNNIFYSADGFDINYFYASSNIIATNNIVYNTDTNPFDIGINGNTGSGNKLNVNPLFTSVTVINDHGYNEDISLVLLNLTLQSTSPGHLAGTDGKDIGLYGGAGAQNPLTGVPAIPQISTMNVLNTVLAPTGTLNVALKAKSSN